MTKRYNLFNYIETYVGIVFLVIPVVILYFSFILNIKSNWQSFSSIVCYFATSILSFIILVPKGIKYIKKGMYKAYKCENDIIYGRVRADEASKNHIMNHLDFVKALEFCNKKNGCVHCPFRISCLRTNYTWMIQSARMSFDKLVPCDEAERLSSLVDRYKNCDDFSNCADCSYYQDDCYNLHIKELQHDVYCLIKRNGYTSANQLRNRL